MSLSSFFDEDPPLQTIEEKIKQRRTQMLIHSYLYYELDDIIVDDDTWQKWANELKDLQKKTKKIGFYDREFKDWNGDSGAFLPKDDYVASKAFYILNLYKGKSK